jgi:phosphoribosylformylglycinamidine synthase
MGKPRVIVLRAPGINCDVETCHAWDIAGAECDLVHLNRVVEDPTRLDGYDILTVPGGFSYGDDIAAGRIFARRMTHHLGDALHAFVQRDRLVLGICNGFQILVEAGLLTANDDGRRCTLTVNTSGQFICRWVTLQAASDRCVFLEKDRRYTLPIAHAEGRFAVDDEKAFDRKRVALRFVEGPSQTGRALTGRAQTGQAHTGLSPIGGPANPNGSFEDVAALTDKTGRVLGLMPHPERFVDRTQHPYWTTAGDDLSPDGLAIFQAAVRQFG